VSDLTPPPPSSPYGNPSGGPYGTPYGSTPSGPPPPSNLVWGILTTILCCLPLGIVSIVYAAQVNGKWFSGDTDGAYRASAQARQWAIWSAVASIVAVVLFGAFALSVGRGS